jgi:hypothetical protein
MTSAGILESTEMTKVQINFKLEKPLDDLLLQRLSDTTSLYGIEKVKLAPAMDRLMVEYDATRLKPAEVASALMGAGIAVTRA